MKGVFVNGVDKNNVRRKGEEEGEQQRKLIIECIELEIVNGCVKVCKVAKNRRQQLHEELQSMHEN